MGNNTLSATRETLDVLWFRKTNEDKKEVPTKKKVKEDEEEKISK